MFLVFCDLCVLVFLGYCYLCEGAYVIIIVCLSVSTFVQKLICMKFSGKVCSGPLNKWLNFGCDLDHRLDTGIVFRIRHYWEIRKVVSTDCIARLCSARHALAGIVIATITSLCHRPTADSGTDIASLVGRALVEVCKVPLLLLILCCHYQFSWLPGKTDPEMTEVISVSFTERVWQCARGLLKRFSNISVHCVRQCFDTVGWVIWPLKARSRYDL